jgi:hypothetical protein
MAFTEQFFAADSLPLCGLCDLCAMLLSVDYFSRGSHGVH